MRIVVCAKNDLAANLAVNELMRALGGCDVTFWLSDIDRPAELADPDLATLRLLERQLPKRWLWPLLANGDDRPADCQGFAALAKRHGADLAIVDSLKNPVWRARLETIAPDLVVSIRFSHIFPASLLAVPRFGVVNLHPGDLPSYAGLFAPFHQLLDGQERLVCSLHWVDPGIDTGPLIDRSFLPVDRSRSLLWHVCHVYPPGVAALVELISALDAGRRPPGEPQNPKHRRYHCMPDALAFERFRRAGWQLVDGRDYEAILERYRAPSDPAAAIHRPALPAAVG